jgi:mannan endo-1,4-beta-mannosidase
VVQSRAVIYALVAAALSGGCVGSVETADAAVPRDFAPSGGDDAGADPRFVGAANGELWLEGARFRFVGANRYDVTSFAPGSGKFHCGNAYDDADVDALFAQLQTMGATVLRTWAFQSFTLGGSDFTTLDRAIAAARAHDVKLIFTLENQWSDCTEPDPAGAGGAKSATWYATGYFTDALGRYALPYRDYARLVVARYRDEPAIAMWQLVNEAECADGAALLGFASDMASVVKSADGNHLLSLGTIGSGQPGTAGAAYRALHALDGIDVVEAHDYGDEETALPGAIAADQQTATALGKPFFIGEAGIAAPAPMYKYTFAQRAALFDAKLAAHWPAGTDGFLIWSFWDLQSDNAQGWDFSPTDPLAAVVAKYAAMPP